jgi:SulP family sulfate permease
MLNQLAADLGKRGVRLVLAAEIGQVRDMVAAVAGDGQAPEYHRTVAEAVTAARSGPVTDSAEEG